MSSPERVISLMALPERKETGAFAWLNADQAWTLQLIQDIMEYQHTFNEKAETINFELINTENGEELGRMSARHVLITESDLAYVHGSVRTFVISDN